VTQVFECKYELDSLAAFLQISTEYFNTTNDSTFFSKYNWTNAVETILNTTTALLIGTYADDGAVNTSPYTWTRQTTAATETLDNKGIGNPVQEGTGLVRSAFRPSDDACIYQLFIPANMMYARYLSSATAIATAIGNTGLASRMNDFSNSIRGAISAHGIVNDPVYGTIYAYEVDGFGGRNIMDDANLPSLLGAPFVGYLSADDEVYQNTRKVLLSKNNPYFMRGPVINA
jgi:meiotically up-regulated gene 157 (Mug157) protein